MHPAGTIDRAGFHFFISVVPDVLELLKSRLREEIELIAPFREDGILAYIREIEREYKVCIADEITIVMLVDKVHTAEEIEAYIMGIADSYLEKPITANGMEWEMRKLVSCHRETIACY